tara:strand:- start:213 stop:620 length:408 start_codon:yes stop_codon:yes gene_type:complete
MKKINLIIVGILSFALIACGGKDEKEAAEKEGTEEVSSDKYNGWPKEEVEEGLKECVAAPEMDEEKCECVIENLSKIIGYEDYEALNERIESNTFTEEDEQLSLEITLASVKCVMDEDDFNEVKKQLESGNMEIR